ncbi:MAG: hypothetical protein R2856_30460 [Caldilineaceae bacterium]
MPQPSHFCDRARCSDITGHLPNVVNAVVPSGERLIEILPTAAAPSPFRPHHLRGDYGIRHRRRTNQAEFAQVDDNSARGGERKLRITPGALRQHAGRQRGHLHRGWRRGGWSDQRPLQSVERLPGAARRRL